MPSTQPAGAQQAHAPLSLDDPREIGGYRVHARLGSGGMGVVYLASTPGGRPIAVKVVREDFAADPEFRRRFAQEVASARLIHGLFTAQVVDHGVDEAVPWLATAYVPGPSLQQVVERHGPLPARTVLLLVAGTAEALQAVHAAGVVHRDLKPANVLVAEDGPRVIDFGIARAADATGLTGTGLRIGTAAYMAPEQALGLPVTSATDVFALGALAAYVAGGVLPFGTGPESAALYRVVHEPADLSRVPGELRALVGWCLAKRPEDRPTPAELIAAVHAHPAVGPSPEFAEGWLPGAVRQEIAGRGAGTAPSHASHASHASQPSGPSPSPAQPSYARPTRAATPAPVRFPTQRVPEAPVVPGASPVPGASAVPSDEGARATPRRTPRRGRRGRRTALLAGAAVVVLALGGGTVYYLSPPEPRSGGAPGATYTRGYSDVELTAPDNHYEFDLAAGKVVPAETATWYLAREGEELVVPENTDAFVASGYGLSPADCERGIDSEPVTRLPFDDLADERPFCVRGSDGERLVVARLVEAGPAGGPVTVVLSQHLTDR
ncbi:serine/threonine protein kinase [Streptomyces zaomyceticus]|uniref:serine/threonine-protein kinase n=1 Tax=Streptomyces zaomyceticus TaxID=68286 RepID=UPI0032505D2B